MAEYDTQMYQRSRIPRYDTVPYVPWELPYKKHACKAFTKFPERDGRTTEGWECRTYGFGKLQYWWSSLSNRKILQSSPCYECERVHTFVYTCSDSSCGRRYIHAYDAGPSSSSFFSWTLQTPWGATLCQNVLGVKI